MRGSQSAISFAAPRLRRLRFLANKPNRNYPLRTHEFEGSLFLEILQKGGNFLFPLENLSPRIINGPAHVGCGRLLEFVDYLAVGHPFHIAQKLGEVGAPNA